MGLMSFSPLSIAHNRTQPLPAPDAARSLPLHTVSELTQEYVDEKLLPSNL